MGQSIEVQKAEMKTVNEAKLFINTIKNMRLTNQIDIAQIHISKNGKKMAHVTKDTIGYFDEKYVYILLKDAYAHTNRFLHGIGEGYALPVRALQSKLDSEEYVIRTEKGRVQSKLTVNSQRINVLKFNRHTFIDE